MEVQVVLNDLRFKAYHGVFEHEKQNGGVFRLDISFSYNAEKAALSDNLDDAIDYGAVCDLAIRAMQKRHDLLETVLMELKVELKKSYPKMYNLELRLYKLNPPVNHTLESVCLVLKD
ncbi:MAG: dihydroneopterin aldolase [Bacteroidia bacterium]